MNRYVELFQKNALNILLVMALVLSVGTHAMVFNEFTMPTYGNTFIHVASIRHMLLHQTYPMNDYSYGGGVPNLYVPFYRMFIANAALLTGLSVDFVSRMAVMLFAVLLPLAFYALANRLFGFKAAVAAAFLCSLPGELLIYTVRPLPQSLGMVLLPVAFLAIVSQKWRTSLFLAFGIAMVHQEAIAFLFAATAAYVGLSVAYDFLFSGLLDSRRSDARQITENIVQDLRGATLAFAVAVVCVLSYLLWHFAVMHSFNIFELAQFKYHEGGVVSVESFMTKTGIIVAMFSLIGLALVFHRLMRMLAGLIMRAIESLFSLRASQPAYRGLENACLFLAVAFPAYFYFNGFSLANPNLLHLGLAIVLGLVSIAFLSFTAALPAFQAVSDAKHLFVFGLFAAGFAMVKNDVVGIRVFMDRFLVHLQEPLVLLAALGIAAVFEFLEAVGERK